MKNKISVAISALSISLVSSFALAEMPTKQESETRNQIISTQEDYIKKLAIDGDAFVNRVVDDIISGEATDSEKFYKKHIRFIDEKINLKLTEEQKSKLFNLMNQQKDSISPSASNSPEFVLKESEELERQMKEILNEEQVAKVENVKSLEITLFNNTFEFNRDDKLIVNGNTFDINQEEIEKMTEEEAKKYFEKIMNQVDVESMKLGFEKVVDKIMTHMQKQMNIQIKERPKMQE